MKNRNIILGIDGVPFKLIDHLSDRGIMPNFKELKKVFTFKEMKSSIPHISSVSWSSIITGKNPGEHGIYGFTELIEGTYTLRYPNFNSLKSKPFWYKYPEKKHVILNVPSTYPARELNGIHVSGFVALDLEKAVYPKFYFPILKEMGYEIDIDSKIAKQQSPNFFFDELFRILNIRKRTYQLLWDKIKWDNFMVVITGSDRIGHFFWNIYEDHRIQYHEKFLEFFQEVDKIIGDLTSKLSDNDTFIIISDHGMELINRNVNLNTYLCEENFLDLTEKYKGYNKITKKSKAFSLDPGRIYLNKKEKYPNGSITKDKEKETIEELKKIFYDLKYKNQKVIKKIYEKEEIYKGKMLSNAPDLILIENTGFRLKGAINKEHIFEKDIYTGKHNDKAFLFINKDININNICVEDIISLLN